MFFFINIALIEKVSIFVKKRTANCEKSRFKEQIKGGSLQHL